MPEELLQGDSVLLGERLPHAVGLPVAALEKVRVSVSRGDAEGVRLGLRVRELLTEVDWVRLGTIVTVRGLGVTDWV